MKSISFLVLVTIILFISQNVNAQRGKNGAKVITSTNTKVNEYTTLTIDASAGATSLTVSNNTLNANNHFGNALAAGDLILIIQMQGASIQGGIWWHNYGYISDYYNTGLYEFAQVNSVQGSNIINLMCGLTNNYTAAGRVQIVRVPRYTTLTVNSGAELTCDTWDGSKGGMLVAETMGNAVVDGTINATGKGFRGGILSPAANQIDVGYYCVTDSTYGAKKGEGIAANGLADGIYGRGAPANGGGGGNAHNAGGGGGSNCSSNFAWNGAGFPDTTTSASYMQAWDLETTVTVPTGVPFHKNASYGGGRGGYTYSSNDQNALLVPPEDLAWGGDFRRPFGGLGGWPLNANVNGLPRLFLGGGGGAGSQNDGYGGAGGNGGGIIYLMVYGNVSGTGTIISDGNPGDNSFGTPTWNGRAGVDGAGGAGGGGAIVLNATGSISAILAQANGGTGGTQIKSKGWGIAANYEAEGPGGGGGGGYIAISNGSISRTTNGGVNGIVTATGSEGNGVTEFPPNGATKGGSGVNDATVTNFIINASNVLTCPSQPVTLNATITGTLPSGTSYGWYSSEFGTTVLSNTLSLTINNPQVPTTYYFGTCPGTYRIPVIMTVSSFVPDAGTNQSLCTGSTVTLNANGGTSYHWLPATGLSSTTIQNPVCNVGITTLYTVHITNADGCQANDTVRVTVNTSANATIAPQAAMCINASPVTLTAAQTGGVWSGPGITNPANGVFNPTTAGVGNIQIIYSIAGMCGDADTTHITVNPLPVVNLGHDTTFCQGGNIILNGGNPGSTYSWTPGGSASQTISVSSSGQYIVQVTNAAACSKRDTINVTVNTNANATISPQAAMCINASPVTLTAAQTGGVWSGPGITNPANGVFNPTTAGAGNIQIIYSIAGMCGNADTTHIIVNPLPVVNLGHDTTFCQGGNILLNAGNPGASYSWTPGGSASQTLSASSSGQYIVQVTNAAACSKRDTINVTVNTIANATITPHAALCINANPVTLTAAQTGGVWSGPGITNPATGVFNPTAAGAGNIQIIYSIAGMCGDADTTHITVNPLPVVNLGHDTTFCQGGNILLNAGNPGSSYSWSPGASTSQTLSVSSSGQYIVQVTNAAACSKRDTINVTVNTNANATITPHAAMCINASPVTLTAAQTGGVWSGPGITNPATGVFNPTAAGAGNIQIIYSIAGMCGDADTTHITVNPLPVVNLGHDTTFCQGGNLLLNAGNAGASYSWSPGASTSQTLSVSSSGQYIVQVTNAAACSKRDTINVTVNTNANATITPHAAMCINASPVTLTAAQTGGVWSGPGITNPANGIFNPTTAGAGNIQIIYSITGMCGDTDTTYISVNPLPVVNLGHDTAFCQGGNILLNAGNPGSTYLWTPGGITSQTLSVSSSGQYIVQVTNAAACSKRDTINVTVNINANATITPHAAMCINASPVTLAAAQTGGVWSGSGITNPSTGRFNPANAGAGNIQIIYSIAGICGDADTTHISVNPLPIVNLGHDTTFCQGVNILLNAGNTGATYSWTPGGSTSQTLSVSSSGQYIVMVTNAASCSKRDTINVTVNTNANATITPHAPMCINASPVTFIAAQTGGVWSGPGITNPATGVFNPATAGAGNIQIIYSISGLCGNADTIHIMVNALPSVNLGNDTTICQGSTLVLNAGNTGSDYLWTNSTTDQTLTVSVSGIYWVEVTNTNLCSSRDSIHVSVVPLADATITTVNPVCSNIPPFDLIAAQTGGVWSGTGITVAGSGTFSPSVAGSGISIITYTISGECGDIDTIHISVFPSPQLATDTVNPGCPDYNNGSIILQTTSGTPPYTYLWNDGATGTSLVDLVNGIYTITVMDANNCKQSESVQFDVPLIDCFTPVVYVPNIFSPNGDGNNDQLFVHGRGIKSLDFIVYDRWGEKVFETIDQSNYWDGTFKGKDMPVDVYAYHLKATMNDGQKIDKKGNISLVR